MYWPTKVGRYGKVSKQASVNIKSGNRVAIMCNNNNKMVIGTNRFINSPNPIVTSQIPSTGINIWGWNQKTVCSTKSPAGLSPIIFNPPNQM